MKTICLVIFLTLLDKPSLVGWDTFARVKFTEKFHKELNEYYRVPLFDSKIRLHEGKDFTLEGYYLPYDIDKNTIIISKNPYSMCFFCGGAGPESVAEIIFTERHPRFKPDQLVKVTGKLKLNDKNINHMNFILENAKVEN